MGGRPRPSGRGPRGRRKAKTERKEGEEATRVFGTYKEIKNSRSARGAESPV